MKVVVRYEQLWYNAASPKQLKKDTPVRESMSYLDKKKQGELSPPQKVQL
jgi:hypothetical protein